MAPRTRLSLYLLSTVHRSLFGEGPADGDARRDLPLRPPNHGEPSQTVWVHAAPSASETAVVALLRRLRAERGEIQIVCTSDDAAALQFEDAAAVRRPLEAGSQIRRFLDNWQPDLALWLGEPVWPALAHEMNRRGIPSILADVTSTRSGPFGTGPEHVVDLFSHVLARTVTDAEILRRSSRRPAHIEASAALREGPSPEPCDVRELDVLNVANAGRPVWLAMAVAADEIGDVIAAHRRAMRLSHRLLLVLAPSQEVDPVGLAADLVRQGWQVERRALRDAPVAGTQIFIADLDDEEALWFRFAPITFLGGSLHPPGGGQDPAAPTALGSAVIFGAHVGRHKAAYRRLTDAGAAVRIDDASDLGDAVADLQSPERAAHIANAAWRVASEGAEVTDRILALVGEILDGAD